jgi:hypothetical protein
VNPPNYLIFSVKLMKNSVFSIGINKVCLIFKKVYWIFNISYFKILNNSEDSQLQAKNTGYSVKNRKNSELNRKMINKNSKITIFMWWLEPVTLF